MMSDSGNCKTKMQNENYNLAPRMRLPKSIAVFLILLTAAIGVTGCQRSHSAGEPVLRKPSKLEGQQVPSFKLNSDTGGEVSSADFTGKSKLVLVFYRGYW